VLLQGKNAVIYGAAGAIGGAAASGFAREGARVFLAGRTQATLDALAAEIRAAGGTAETAVVDALDGASVDAHADAVVEAGGSLDISFNVIAHPFTHGTPMVEMDVEDYLAPAATAIRTQFLTVKAGARHMKRQGGGVFLAFGGSGDPMRDYFIGGTQVAFDAVESMRRQLATELGGSGVRFVTLRTSGIADSLPAEAPGRDAIVQGIVEAGVLPYAAELGDVGAVAAFAASDRARTMTAATVNISGGALID
jgi:NAD(P)-dependent dehydrogenase (short-subunit alcohol dehydrogenase family)